MATTLRKRPPTDDKDAAAASPPEDAPATSASSELQKELEETRRRLAELEAGRRRIEELIGGKRERTGEGSPAEESEAPAEESGGSVAEAVDGHADEVSTTKPTASVEGGSASATVEEIEEFLARLRTKIGGEAAPAAAPAPAPLASPPERADSGRPSAREEPDPVAEPDPASDAEAAPEPTPDPVAEAEPGSEPVAQPEPAPEPAPEASEASPDPDPEPAATIPEGAPPAAIPESVKKPSPAAEEDRGSAIDDVLRRAEEARLRLRGGAKALEALLARDKPPAPPAVFAPAPMASPDPDTSDTISAPVPEAPPEPHTDAAPPEAGETPPVEVVASIAEPPTPAATEPVAAEEAAPSLTESPGPTVEEEKRPPEPSTTEAPPDFTDEESAVEAVVDEDFEDPDEYSVWVPPESGATAPQVGSALASSDDEFSVWVPPESAADEVEEADEAGPEVEIQPPTFLPEEDDVVAPTPAETEPESGEGTEEGPPERFADPVDDIAARTVAGPEPEPEPAPVMEAEPELPDEPDEEPASVESGETAPTTGVGEKLRFLFDEGECPGNVNLGFLRSYLRESLDRIRESVADGLRMEYTGDPRRYLRHHSRNVARLAMHLGLAARLSEEEVLRVGMAALLHDVGILELPDEIVFSAGGLSARDTVIFQEHTEIGAEIAASIGGMHPDVPEIIRQHHELLDGSGYPDGVRGDAIHPLARLLSIVDAYDAIASPRVSDAGGGWKKREKVRVRDLVAIQAEDLPSELSPEELVRPSASAAMSALLEFEAWKFEADFVQAFVQSMGVYPIGSLIELGKGEVARVVEIHKEALARPIVQVIRDRSGKRPKVEVRLDLLAKDKTQIKRAIPSQPRD